MSSQPLYHRSNEFYDLSARLWNSLSYAFDTRQPVHVLAGSATTGIEAAMVNTMVPGSTIVVATHGRFGERLVQIALKHGLHVHQLNEPWGNTITPERIVQTLEAYPETSAVWLVHVETSTGVALDLQGISHAIRDLRPSVLICVDAVTSIGVQEFRSDAWGLDVVITGSQKGLAAPPGLSAVMLSERVAEMLDSRDSPSYTYDFKRIRLAQKENKFVFTPPVTLVAALAASTQRLANETLPLAWNRHRELWELLKSGLADIGLDLYGTANATGLLVCLLPEADAVRNRLKINTGIQVAGGQDGLANSVLRIGTMGNVDRQDIGGLLEALKTAIQLPPTAHS